MTEQKPGKREAAIVKFTRQVRQNLLTSISAVLLICAVGIWIRADWTKKPDAVPLRTPFGRLVFKSGEDGVEILGISGPSAGESAFRTALLPVRNEDVIFEGTDASGGTFPNTLKLVGASVEFSDRVNALLFTTDPPSDACRRPLLEALEDPDRFVVAHALLDRIVWERERLIRVSLEETPGGYEMEVDGLRARVPPPKRFGTPSRDRGPSGRTFWRYKVGAQGGAKVDPAQLPAIRSLWHQRLSDRLLRVPHWALVSMTAVVPLLWVLRRAKAKVRRRAGRCPDCGYDIRATPQRCPECGASFGCGPSPVT